MTLVKGLPRASSMHDGVVEFGLLVKNTFNASRRECPLRFSLGQVVGPAETSFFASYPDGTPIHSLYLDGDIHPMLSAIRALKPRLFTLDRGAISTGTVYCYIRLIGTASRDCKRYNLRFLLPQTARESLDNYRSVSGEML